MATYLLTILVLNSSTSRRYHAQNCGPDATQARGSIRERFLGMAPVAFNTCKSTVDI
jgi:hypothetical protein